MCEVSLLRRKLRDTGLLGYYRRGNGRKEKHKKGKILPPAVFCSIDLLETLVYTFFYVAFKSCFTVPALCITVCDFEVSSEVV